MALPESTINKFASYKLVKYFKEDGKDKRIDVVLRYDDSCNNGHNTFGITGTIYPDGTSGCIHDEIAKHFPQLAKYIKWHLCSSDGPLHYIANTKYHASYISPHQDKYYVYLEDSTLGIREILLGIFSSQQTNKIRAAYPTALISTKEYYNPMAKEPDLEAARHTAIWPDATLEQLQDEDALNARLPALMEEFREAMRELGFKY